MSVVSLQARVARTVNFSPRLQHAVRLLQMSTLDYAQALRDTALANPFLEIEEPAAPAAQADSAGASKVRENHGAEIDWLHGLDRMAAGGLPAVRHPTHAGSPDPVQQAPGRLGLAAHLRAQLCILQLERRERLLVEVVIEALDEDGYLRLSLEDLAAGLDDDGEDAVDDLRIALRRVQDLEPAGVAARDLAECLCLQLRDVADPCVRALATRMASEQLELVASRRMARLAARLQVSEDAVHQAFACILSLCPRPGAAHEEMHVQTIVPDVIVRKVGGIWRTAQNADALTRVRLHDSYVALFERHREHGDIAMKACLEQARWTVRNATQRITTILDIATAVVERQKLFLEYGHLAMKPLGLGEIADAVGVHPSTVSRAVRHKYLATPHGVLELHRFFSRGMAHAGGGASAPSALQALIRELVLAERPESPLSDADLARELTRQGFLIARRTVTKYRQGLSIDAVERRRRA